MTTLVRHVGLAPHRLHDLDGLAQHPDTGLRVGELVAVPVELVFVPPRADAELAAAAALCGLLALTGCASLQSSDNFLGVVTPYRIDIVQGNVVTKEQAAVVKPGMVRAQVRDILGSPLLADAFHADRWDYVFTIRRQGTEPQRSPRRRPVSAAGSAARGRG